MTDFSPRISVVTRTCNRPALLARAAAGLRAQTATFEWVIVNDGDAALSASDLDGVGETHQLIDRDVRLGRAGAAKAGIEAASGRYIMLHDDDDALMPDALAKLANYLDAHPDEVAVSCGYEVQEESADQTASSSQRSLAVHVPKLPPRLYDMAERNRLLTIGTLFRKSAYEQCGGMRTDINALEDWDLWLRLMTIGDIGMVPEVLARQYVRASGIHGAAANSDRTDHERARIRLQNSWLREDIAAGRLGLGDLTHRPHAQFIDEMDDRLKRAGSLKRKLMPWTRRKRGQGTSSEEG